MLKNAFIFTPIAQRLPNGMNKQHTGPWLYILLAALEFAGFQHFHFIPGEQVKRKHHKSKLIFTEGIFLADWLRYFCDLTSKHYLSIPFCCTDRNVLSI